ncbi:hypothetical protein F5Y04DRAFT_229251 [Hypomontagnella monticulosa]|nr:hypothetical protein F5Y04DRAFT_229251 [Hypomontagnella monticulosa]
MSLVLDTITHTNTPLPGLDSDLTNSNLTVAAPLSRRGHGPSLLLLVDADLDLRKHEKTPDPPPLHKWAEEGFAVAELRVSKSEGGQIRNGLRLALSELARLPSCDQVDKIGIIIYLPSVEHALLEKIEECSEICAVVCYGVPPGGTVGSRMPLLSHMAGPKRAEEGGVIEGRNEKRHYYPGAKPFFAIPAHENYHGPSASVAHTRTLSFLKPLLGGPYFDLEQVWDEHTYWEFEARSVDETMATMVEEPYVNHIPTLTGGIGRAALTEFYRDHFIFSNPPDTELKLISRTVGIDRVVDEFLFEATHDRIIDWLAPGIPATGRFISVPFTSVVNIRGDRLYHEHISWDQATLLRQLGLLPDYLPFPYPTLRGEAMATETGKDLEYRLPVAGMETARKLANQSSVESNVMLQYRCRRTN